MTLAMSRAKRSVTSGGVPRGAITAEVVGRLEVGETHFGEGGHLGCGGLPVLARHRQPLDLTRLDEGATPPVTENIASMRPAISSCTAAGSP